MGKILPIGSGSPMRAKIAVALPSHDMVPVTFGYDLASMLMMSMGPLSAHGASVGVHLSAGTYVHSARQELIDFLMADGYTHILWLDTDMRFPTDSLIRLLQHDVPMVGINYAKRRIPTDFVALKKISFNGVDRSERLITTAESTGLEEVDAVGFGMVLMKVAALKNMPDPKVEPWFWFKWLPDIGQQIGEDVQFCKLFRESGQKILVDHDLSKECAHIGQWEYRCAHVKLQQSEAAD